MIRRPRGVAQSGSAPGWGPGGRRFKSCLPDARNSCKWPLPYKRESGHFASGLHWGSIFENNAQISRACEPVLRYLVTSRDRPVSRRGCAHDGSDERCRTGAVRSQAKDHARTPQRGAGAVTDLEPLQARNSEPPPNPTAGGEAAPRAQLQRPHHRSPFRSNARRGSAQPAHLWAWDTPMPPALSLDDGQPRSPCVRDARQRCAARLHTQIAA